VSEHAEAALPLAGLVGLAPEGAAQTPLVPAEGALRLPPLTEYPLGQAALRPGYEPPDHLAAVLPARKTGVTAAIDRDDGRADAQFPSGVLVVSLGVERGVGQHPVPLDGQRRLGQDGPELRGVVGRAGSDGGAGDEVAGRVAGGGEFGPGPSRGRLAGPLDEVPGRVTAFQPGGVDRGGRLPGDQAGVVRGRGGAEEEDDELPFFNSRWWA
jgi:hypothetical protein